MRVCHFSSVHRDADVRIYHKECGSLAARGHEVHLVISASQSYRGANGVYVHALEPLSRLTRMTVGAWRAYRKAKLLDADIYHFHDPELLPYGYALALVGKLVVYDVHEDVPADIQSKEWIPKMLRNTVASIYKAVETFICKRLSAIVAATPHIAKRYAGLGVEVCTVNNYPLTQEFRTVSGRLRSHQLCYVGGIDEIRGVQQMVNAASKAGVPLVIAGRFPNAASLDSAKQLPGWSNIDYKGEVARDEVGGILSESSIGLVLFHPLPNHVNAQPNKLFEYMSAGLPVVASDFPLWRDIIYRVGCGICVDPLSPDAIASAVSELLQDPVRLKGMGESGRKAIEQIYNWEVEQNTLLNLYDSLDSRRRA